MSYCPLAASVYNEKAFRVKIPKNEVKKAIKKAIESKIRKFGFFTKKRKIEEKNIAIPYGASEMLMYALRKRVIDCAVIACDGAGTVVTSKPDVVQGVGARMNGLFFTSPIPEVIERLEKEGCIVPFPDARINQTGGVKAAAGLGYKKIAVTVNGFGKEKLSVFREIEKEYNISITVLVVCTTGVARARAREISKFSDLAWSCASGMLRETAGDNAILQISKKIPVFAFTVKGIAITEAYSSKLISENMNFNKQYVIWSHPGGQKLKMGNFVAYLREAKLPVRSRKEPLLTREPSNPKTG